jgi:hypothetical protein
LFVSVSHRPFNPVQSAFFVHWTHSCVALHALRPTGHAVTFVVLHCTHGPVRHAGSCVVVHASVAATLPLSPLQALQVLDVKSQTGVFPVHFVTSCVQHWTHLSFVVSHSKPALSHLSVSLAVQSTQEPFVSHAGAVVVGQARGLPPPLLPPQGEHAPAWLHTGVSPEHSADVRHCTQTFGLVGVPQCPLAH